MKWFIWMIFLQTLPYKNFISPTFEECKKWHINHLRVKGSKIDLKLQFLFWEWKRKWHSWGIMIVKLILGQVCVCSTDHFSAFCCCLSKFELACSYFIFVVMFLIWFLMMSVAYIVSKQLVTNNFKLNSSSKLNFAQIKHQCKSSKYQTFSPHPVKAFLIF